MMARRGPAEKQFLQNVARRQRVPQGTVITPNQRWSMEFVSDRLVDGRWFLVLIVVDQFTRECLLLLVDSSLNGGKVDAARYAIMTFAERSESRATL